LSKRIFTKVFSGTTPAMLEEVTAFNAQEAWLVQEDIEVIGAELVIQNALPSENDGFAYCSIELSQVGVMSQDGAILKAASAEGWNTTPAGVDHVNGHAVVNFPLGLAVPVKEEGYLYINLSTYGKSAGASTFNWGCIVYYTKKGSR